MRLQFCHVMEGNEVGFVMSCSKATWLQGFHMKLEGDEVAKFSRDVGSP